MILFNPTNVLLRCRCNGPAKFLATFILRSCDGEGNGRSNPTDQMCPHPRPARVYETTSMRGNFSSILFSVLLFRCCRCCYILTSFPNKYKRGRRAVNLSLGRISAGGGHPILITTVVAAESTLFRERKGRERKSRGNTSRLPWKSHCTDSLKMEPSAAPGATIEFVRC